MEAANHHLHAGRTKATARGNSFDCAPTILTSPCPLGGNAARDLVRAHTGIGLVHGHDIDRQIRAEQLPLGRAEGKARTAASEFDGMVERSHCTPHSRHCS